jgi:DNA-binding CsgD family transcriptional regulator
MYEVKKSPATSHAGAPGSPTGSGLPGLLAMSLSRTYQGPERRATGRDPAAWLTRMLDEIDYGMLLVTADAQVAYLNHAARLELDGHHPLQLSDHRLGAHSPPDVAPLYEALAGAQRGLRKLLTLGEGVQQVSISVVPLPAMPAAAGGLGSGGGEGALTLLVLGKRQVCEQLSVQGYARSHHLTPAETRVLEGLCGGVQPSQIAANASVAVSTVRTQIGSIRIKTGASSIRELVRQVAVLPPLVGALRESRRQGAG